MPAFESIKKGDLIVTFEVTFPESLSESQKAAIVEVFKKWMQVAKQNFAPAIVSKQSSMGCAKESYFCMPFKVERSMKN